jgi:hypothetical protein
MFAFECSNPVWGRSTNPYNDAYTCGGSSGGEAALLAMDGSAIGIGSDVGGSLRIPAAYCGIYSLKPSQGRISPFGTRGKQNSSFRGRLAIVNLIPSCCSWLRGYQDCRGTYGTVRPPTTFCFVIEHYRSRTVPSRT